MLGASFAIGAVVSANSVYNQSYEAAHATDPVSYISRSWDGYRVVETENTCTDYIVVNGSTTQFTNMENYVVNSNVTISGSITVNAGYWANLIICDGCTLTVENGIRLSIGNVLNVYGQALGTGNLVSTTPSDECAAGIGGWGYYDDSSIGKLNIHGVNVTAEGGLNAAGIGSAAQSSGPNIAIRIFAGTINATGGANGAGIGGANVTDCLVEIYGGTVNAHGGASAAGIGGGGPGSSNSNMNVRIYGGRVNAYGYEPDSAGIGGGYYGQGTSVSITGGEVYAQGGSNAFGIGHGESGTSHRSLTVASGYTVLGNNSNWPSDSDTHTDYGSNRWKYMKVKSFHSHDWSYAANGASITATCNGSGVCTATTGLTLTIEGQDYTYDGTAKTASIVSGYNTAVFGTQTISYYKDNTLVDECIEPGTYEARVTVGGETAVKSFTIATSTPTGLTATYGDLLSSVALPDGWSWKTPTDTVGNVGNQEHTAIRNNVEHVLTVAVSKANPTYTVPTAKTNLVYNGSSQALINEGTITGGTIQYKLGSEGTYGTSIPTATNVGTYSVYYKVVGDSNHNNGEENSFDVTISKANPTYVVPEIDAPYDVALSTIGLPEGFAWMDGAQKTSTWGENTFKAKYTPSDTANYNVVENIDIKVNVKWILVDPTQEHVNVEIDGVDEKFTVDITIKVEIKTEISVDQKRTDYANLATESFVNKNEDIAAIYGVKLIRTTNGVEEEIQPSDIKEGTKIIVSMDVPEELVGKEFRLLHIHNADDINEVTNYALTKDGKTLMVEVDRLSEFAFIIATDTDNGFDYSIPGLPGWAVLLIVLGSILLLGILALLILFIFFPVYYIDYNKKELRRAIYIRTKHDEVLMLNTHLQKVRRNEVDVYEKKEDAIKAFEAYLSR